MDELMQGIPVGQIANTKWARTAAIPEAPQPQQVTIVPVENGMIVYVGCKLFVFLAWRDASEAIDLYLKNSEDAQKRYCKI